MGNSLLIGSINVITAQLPNSGFKAVWKRSGLNFALLAVGGSVVEIMIPFFEIFSKNYGAGDLGPGVILGELHMCIIRSVYVHKYMET